MLKVEIKKQPTPAPPRFKEIPVGSVFEVIALDAKPGNYFLKTSGYEESNSLDLASMEPFTMFQQTYVKLVTTARLVIVE